MQVVQKDLMSMKVTELKEELEARGESKTGNKAWLRRRLHAAIVRARLQEAVEERARGYGEPRTLSGIIRALFKPLLMTFQTVIINLKLLPVPGRTCKVLCFNLKQKPPRTFKQPPRPLL